MNFAWLHETEPFSNEELASMGRLDLATDHEEVEETISQFEACVQEIILQPYKQTVMSKTETQKEIARRLENRQSPEFIAQEMGIPIGYIKLLKK